MKHHFCKKLACFVYLVLWSKEMENCYSFYIFFSEKSIYGFQFINWSENSGQLCDEQILLLSKRIWTITIIYCNIKFMLIRNEMLTSGIFFWMLIFDLILIMYVYVFTMQPSNIYAILAGIWTIRRRIASSKHFVREKLIFLTLILTVFKGM